MYFIFYRELLINVLSQNFNSNNSYCSYEKTMFFFICYHTIVVIEFSINCFTNLIFLTKLHKTFIYRYIWIRTELIVQQYTDRKSSKLDFSKWSVVICRILLYSLWTNKTNPTSVQRLGRIKYQWNIITENRRV